MKNINFCVPQIQIINKVKYTNLQKQIKIDKIMGESNFWFYCDGYKPWVFLNLCIYFIDGQEPTKIQSENPKKNHRPQKETNGKVTTPGESSPTTTKSIISYQWEWRCN